MRSLYILEDTRISIFIVCRDSLSPVPLTYSCFSRTEQSTRRSFGDSISRAPRGCYLRFETEVQAHFLGLTYLLLTHPYIFTGHCIYDPTASFSQVKVSFDELDMNKDGVLKEGELIKVLLPLIPTHCQ